MGKKDKVKVEFESTMELDQAISYLEGLLDGLKSGTVHVERDTESVTLHPHDPVTLQVEAKQKEKKESFEIAVKWYRVPEADATGLTISDEEPQGHMAGSGEAQRPSGWDVAGEAEEEMAGEAEDVDVDPAAGLSEDDDAFPGAPTWDTPEPPALDTDED
jgi:amphi-Trp domain-containing protein